MRLVEKVPFGGQRDHMHDRICAAIVDEPELVLRLFDWGDEEPTIEILDVEVPCGYGFADVVLTCETTGGLGPSFCAQTDGRASFRMIVEVKSDAENASAG